MAFTIQKEFLNFRDTFRTDEGSTVIAFLCLGGNSTTCAWEGADCHRAAVFAGFGCKERSAPLRAHVVLFSSVESLNSYDNRFAHRIFRRILKSWTQACFAAMGPKQGISLSPRHSTHRHGKWRMRLPLTGPQSNTHQPAR